MPAPSPSAGDASALVSFFAASRGYWLGSRAPTAWLLASGLLAVTLGHALLQLRLNLWLGDFFNALDVHAGGRLWHDIAIFVMLAVGLMVTAASQIWLKARLQSNWRGWLTLRLLGHWLNHGHAYLLRFQDREYDNPDYRIAEDVRLAVESAVDFATGLVNSALVLVMFLDVLWAISRTEISASPFYVPGYLAITAVVYGLSSGLLTHAFGRRLVPLSEKLHIAEGNFRYNLVRVRDDAEKIALSRGEPDERRVLEHILDQLLLAWRRLVSLQTRVAFLSSGFTVAAPVVPLLVAAPQYLAGAISLGSLIQASQAFVQVQTALGFFSDNYARISDSLASMRRITTFERGIAEIEQSIARDPNGFINVTRSQDGALRFIQLNIATPEGTAVIADASNAIHPGERVLLVGESGAGKTTLFRAIARLWPWGSGTIELPGDQRMVFVARQPYVPSGSLRTALAYPEPADNFSTSAMIGALRRCGLEPYVGRLDEDARWSDIMSEADQQRFSFARLLLQQPGWVFMDEATSELDAEAEAGLMSIFEKELAGRTVVSTGQHASLTSFYNRSILLEVSKTGAHFVKDEPPLPARPGILHRLLVLAGLRP